MGHRSRIGVCSFVKGGTGGALPEPYKMTSSGLIVRMFLTKRERVWRCNIIQLNRFGGGSMIVWEAYPWMVAQFEFERNKC